MVAALVLKYTKTTVASHSKTFPKTGNYLFCLADLDHLVLLRIKQVEDFPSKDDAALMLSRRNCCLCPAFNYCAIGITYYDIWLLRSV